MYLFSRRVTLVGNPRDTMPWASSITEYVNSATSLELSCWSVSYGFPLGTVVWSARVASQAAHMAAVESLSTDDKYFDLIEQARDMITEPGHDRLISIINGTPGAVSAVGSVGSVVQATTATAIVDRMADAVTWSVEIAKHVEDISGYPVTVGLERFGQMGTITWLSTTPDMESADVAYEKGSADPSYLNRLATTKGLFVPGSAHVAQAVRFA